MDALLPPTPLEMSGNVSENWKKFKQHFQPYIDATGASEKSDKQQMSLLIHVIGESALEVYNTFVWEETEDRMKLAKVLEHFDEYCTPKTNLTLERFHFNQCVQETGEGVDAYLTRIKKHSKTCEFGDLKDSLVKDCLVCGIADNVTRERLLREENLTLEKAVKICKAAELVKERSKELQSTLSTPTTVHAVQTRGKQPSQSGKKPTPVEAKLDKSDKSGEKHHCRRCATWHVSGKCPTCGQTCGLCKRMNHYAKCCLSH